MFRGCFSKKPKETSGDFKGGNFGELRAKHLGSQSTRWLAQQTHVWVILWNPARFKDVTSRFAAYRLVLHQMRRWKICEIKWCWKASLFTTQPARSFHFFSHAGKKTSLNMSWRPHFDQDYKSHPGGRWWCHFFFIYPDPWGDDPILTCAIFFKRVGSTIN